jgi:hypothetical protein
LKTGPGRHRGSEPDPTRLRQLLSYSNASKKFVQIDRYVKRRLSDLMRKRYGRNLRPRQWQNWTREWFEAQGLYRLRGTIRYPGYAS